MANKVYLDKAGIIRNDYDGDQTHVTVQAVADETQALINQLRQQSMPICILVDLSKLGRSTAEARKGSNDAFKQFDFDKMALFGANVFMKTIVSFITKVSGVGQKVKYFNTESEALIWLK